MPADRSPASISPADLRTLAAAFPPPTLVDARGATPFDVAGVDYSHAGAQRSFGAFIRLHGLADPALDRLAAVVRGADTDALGLAPEAPGLLALSLGMSRIVTDDLAMLRFGMLVYDALYAWCADAGAQRRAAG